MSFIFDLLSWFKVNWANIAEIYIYIVAVASIVVKITPSTKDDIWLANMVAFISKYLALNPEEPKKK